MINLEIDALKTLFDRIGGSFNSACQLMLECSGKIIITGMGKSGHIGKKIAATLASTGSPAFFVHPGEASHGDLGMIHSDDVVLAISNSGTTEEVTTILPLLKRQGVPLIAMTGNFDSTLSRQADVSLDISVNEEACSLGLAPTSSTTVTLVLGDALAMALLKAKGFTADDFALAHPGGALGKRLILKVDDIMHTGDSLPLVKLGSSLPETILTMSEKRLGMAIVVDQTDTLCGVYTDGDIRRTIQLNIDIQSAIIDDLISGQCRTIKPNTLAAEALKVMETNKINGLVIINEQNQPIGALNMQDLLQSGVV